MSGVLRSLIMLSVFPRQREVERVSMDSWFVWVMDWVLFTTLCSLLRSWTEQEPYQAAIQPERMLSMVQLWKFGESSGVGQGKGVSWEGAYWWSDRGCTRRFLMPWCQRPMLVWGGGGRVAMLLMIGGGANILWGGGKRSPDSPANWGTQHNGAWAVWSRIHQLTYAHPHPPLAHSSQLSKHWQSAGRLQCRTHPKIRCGTLPFSDFFDTWNLFGKIPPIVFDKSVFLNQWISY